MLLLGLEKAVEKVLVVAKLGVLHALHEALYGETSSDGKVIELVERARPLWVLSEPFVKSRDLANLDGGSASPRLRGVVFTYDGEVTHYTLSSA